MPVYGVAVCIVNYALKRIVLAGTRWMRFKEITAEAKFQMTLLFVLQFVNVCLPLLMINLNLENMEWVQSIQKELYFDFAGRRKGGEFFFGGKYTDTNRKLIS